MPVERTSDAGRELKLVDRERVAVSRLAASAAALEPGAPLRRRAVRERVRIDASPRLLLQPVVTDRLRGSHRLLDVARIELAGLEDGVRPHARVAVCLQLEPDGGLIRALGVRAPDLLDLRARAELLLDVVADLVRDHVRPCEVAAGLEPALHVAVEGEVEVYVIVGRAVERTDRGARRAAASVYAVPVEHQLGPPVILALLGERALPGRLGAVEDVGGEVLEIPLGVLVRRDRLAGRRARRGVEAGRDVEAARATAQELDRDEHDHAHDAEPAADRKRRATTATTAAAAHVDHVSRRSSASPAHDGTGN